MQCRTKMLIHLSNLTIFKRYLSPCSDQLQLIERGVINILYACSSHYEKNIQNQIPVNPMVSTPFK